jgi:hypothetical protein
MKTPLTIGFLLLPLVPSPAAGEDPDHLALHREGSSRLADDQDELSADVQQLVIEQTVPAVIELLEKVEEIMDEATDRLAQADTGGATIAAQTEIIEKIHAAAKQRQSQGGGGKSGGAMMDMLERMMGKTPGTGAAKPGKDGQAGDSGGKGSSGLSDSTNDAAGGDTQSGSSQRRVPKASGTAGRDIPAEFRKAFDAYNRGLQPDAK